MPAATLASNNNTKKKNSLPISFSLSRKPLNQAPRVNPQQIATATLLSCRERRNMESWSRIKRSIWSHRRSSTFHFAHAMYLKNSCLLFDLELKDACQSAQYCNIRLHHKKQRVVLRMFTFCVSLHLFTLCLTELSMASHIWGNFHPPPPNHPYH